jgi:hypothetical protein
MGVTRQFKDSGYLNWISPAIAVDEKVVASFDDRFDPYNDVKIVNLSDEDLEIEVNSHSTQICPRGSELQLNQIIRRDLRIKNIGTATTTAGSIRVLYRNTGFKGDKIKSIAKTIGGGALWLIR